MFKDTYIATTIQREILCVCAAGAVTVRMATIGRVFVVNSGEELRLECEFHADQFNLFDNPILWRKTQLEEATQINMMGNMVEPFESTHRFRVTLIQRPSRYLFSLHIAGRPYYVYSHVVLF